MQKNELIIKGNILFVDDEVRVLESLLRLLRKRIIPTPHTATSAQEALSILRTTEIDVMVTDMQMPEIDGVTLISLAKQIQPELECIVLTGYPGIGNAAKAMQYGAVDYLEKPCDIDKLLLSIQRSLDRLSVVQATYKRLLATNNRLNMILTATTHSIVCLDMDGKISLVNNAASKLFQLEREQLLGKNFHKLIHHSKVDGTPYQERECPVCLALQKGRPLERTTETFCRNDNSFFSVHVSCMPLYENNEVVGAVVSIEDNTELHHLQSLTKELEEQHAVLDQHVPLGIVWVDAETLVIVDVNSAALKLFNATKKQVAGRNYRDFLCAKDKQCPVFSTTRKNVRNERSVIKDINDAEVSVMRSISSVTVSGRKYLLETLTDTTNQDKTNIDLLTVEEKFNSIVSRSSDGILIIDYESIVQYANDASLLLFGLQHDEIVGQLFRFPHTSGDSVEIELVNSQGNPVVAEMQIADTQWKNREAHIANIRDISVRKKIERHTLHTANHDRLTGLPNRNLLNDRLGQLLSLTKRYNQIAAVIFIDLDEFKYINDTYGHNDGDAVLIAIARRLKKLFRSSDVIARIGGDEFLAALRDITEQKYLERILENLIKVLNEPIFLSEKEVVVGCSVGVSLYPQDGVDLDELVKNADRAMYRVKEKGKNNYMFFS